MARQTKDSGPWYDKWEYRSVTKSGSENGGIWPLALSRGEFVMTCAFFCTRVHSTRLQSPRPFLRAGLYQDQGQTGAHEHLQHHRIDSLHVLNIHNHPPAVEKAYNTSLEISRNSAFSNSDHSFTPHLFMTPFNDVSTSLSTRPRPRQESYPTASRTDETLLLPDFDIQTTRSTRLNASALSRADTLSTLRNSSAASERHRDTEGDRPHFRAQDSSRALRTTLLGPSVGYGQPVSLRDVIAGTDTSSLVHIPTIPNIQQLSTSRPPRPRSPQPQVAPVNRNPLGTFHANQPIQPTSPNLNTFRQDDARYLLPSQATVNSKKQIPSRYNPGARPVRRRPKADVRSNSTFALESNVKNEEIGYEATINGEPEVTTDPVTDSSTGIKSRTSVANPLSMSPGRRGHRRNTIHVSSEDVARLKPISGNSNMRSVSGGNRPAPAVSNTHRLDILSEFPASEDELSSESPAEDFKPSIIDRAASNPPGPPKSPTEENYLEFMDEEEEAAQLAEQKLKEHVLGGSAYGIDVKDFAIPSSKPKIVRKESVSQKITVITTTTTNSDGVARKHVRFTSSTKGRSSGSNITAVSPATASASPLLPTISIPEKGPVHGGRRTVRQVLDRVEETSMRNFRFPALLLAETSGSDSQPPPPYEMLNLLPPVSPPLSGTGEIKAKAGHKTRDSLSRLGSVIGGLFGVKKSE